MPLNRKDRWVEAGARNAPTRRCIVFAVDETEYGIAVRDVKRTMPAPRHAESAVTVHGEPYPIVDARAVFGLVPSTTMDRMLLAVEGTRGRAGLIVDRVVGLTSVEEQAIVPLPKLFEGAERRWLEGLVRINSHVVALVRTDALVDSRQDPASPACLVSPSGDGRG